MEGLEALQRLGGLPDTSPVLPPPKRAQGTHQMVCPLRACNGLTPVSSPPQPQSMALCWALSYLLQWPGLPGQSQPCPKISPLEEQRRLTGTLLPA